MTIDNDSLLEKASDFLCPLDWTLLRVNRGESITMASNQQRRLPTGHSPRAAAAPPRPPKPTTSSHGRPVAPVATDVVRGSSPLTPQPQQQPPVLERRLRLSATVHRVHVRRTAAERVAIDGEASRGTGDLKCAQQGDRDAASAPPGREDVSP